MPITKVPSFAPHSERKRSRASASNWISVTSIAFGTISILSPGTPSSSIERFVPAEIAAMRAARRAASRYK